MENCKSNTISHYNNDEDSKVINKKLDIFNDAKFGSKYVTRNGDIALYLCDCILVVSGIMTPMNYNHKGIAIGKDKGYDIIGKYNLWYKLRNFKLMGVKFKLRKFLNNLIK